MMHWFITGSSKGLGLAIAQNLLQNSHNQVTGFSRNAAIIHAQYNHIQIDLADAKAVCNYPFPLIENSQKIVLVNNAATLGEIKYCGDLSNEIIVQSHILNIITPHVMMNKFIEAYKNHPAEKVIVNITSGAASSPYDGWSLYGSAKAGLDMLTRITQKEMQLRNYNIKVFGIAPGVLNTGMQNEIRNADAANFHRKEKFVQLYAENALRNPDEAAHELINRILHPELISDVISKL